MPRADLLALTDDDLATLANRGVVKRARRELDDGTPTFALEERADGAVVCRWSDGVACGFPAGKTVADAACSSGVPGITRHVVRSVMAYQRHWDGKAGERAAGEGVTGDHPAPHPGPPPKTGEGDSETGTGNPASASATVVTAWNPGDVTDEQLAARFGAAAVHAARRRFEAGTLVELERGAKPAARFLDEPCVVRFLVPHDVRYCAHDCAEAALATFVPLAVWAFRRLPAERSHGVVAVQSKPPAVPAERLAELDGLLAELAADGFDRASPVWRQRWERLEDGLRGDGLAWPAELAGELREQHARHAAHDALFDPLEALAALGELVVRARAIAGAAPDLPQFLVRGGGGERVAEIAGGRFVGLGVGVRLGRKSATLSAYLQDAATGNASVLERTFADPESGPPRPFAELAEAALARGVTLGSVGRSQALLKAGKRSPTGRLTLPRGAAGFSANPQNYAWEQLRPPLAEGSFARLAERWQALPPLSLRPRRATENLHVVALQGLAEVRFDGAEQRLTATLHDAEGGQATLALPFHDRARSGFDALAAELERGAGEARFVSGHCHATARGLAVRPVAVVFGDGAARRCVQPWIDAGPPDPARGNASTTVLASAPSAAPLDGFLAAVEAEAAATLTAGLRAADVRQASAWRSRAERGRALGLLRFAAPLEELAERLARKADDLAWDSRPAAAAFLRTALLLRLAADVPR